MLRIFCRSSTGKTDRQQYLTYAETVEILLLECFDSLFRSGEHGRPLRDERVTSKNQALGKPTLSFCRDHYRGIIPFMTGKVQTALEDIGSRSQTSLLCIAMCIA